MRIDEIKSATFTGILREAGEATRLRILNLLRQGELCVADIQLALGLSEPMVSRHLARLRNAHLVDVNRVGQRRIYRITHDRSPATIVLRHFLAEIGAKEPRLRRDSASLTHLPTRRASRRNSGAVQTRVT